MLLKACSEHFAQMLNVCVCVCVLTERCVREMLSAAEQQQQLMRFSSPATFLDIDVDITSQSSALTLALLGVARHCSQVSLLPTSHNEQPSTATHSARWAKPRGRRSHHITTDGALIDNN